jgi:ribonuclease-3
VKLPALLAAVLDDHADLDHLEQALTHPSHANERKKGPRLDYQRLEFLGDAVIQLCVSEALMARFPEAREGELSFLRSSIVSTEALADYARSVDLGASLLLGRGADAAGERAQSTVLADAIEAVVGAVYLDRGLDVARALVTNVIELGLEARGQKPLRDAKSELQEKVQALGGAAPRYRLVGTTGPDHSRQFSVEVDGLGRVLGRGAGRSKKAAEQDAARAGLQALEPSE